MNYIIMVGALAIPAMAVLLLGVEIAVKLVEMAVGG